LASSRYLRVASGLRVIQGYLRFISMMAELPNQTERGVNFVGVLAAGKSERR